MPRRAFVPPVQPQVSNTTPIAPQIEAQRPISPAGSRITTAIFLLVVLTIGWVLYTVGRDNEYHDPNQPAVEQVQDENVTDDLNWEAGERP